jgi:hypothetical protein
MQKSVLILAIALMLLGGVAEQAFAAGRPGFSGSRRGLFNPFSVRPSVRPEGRINPFGLFGGSVVENNAGEVNLPPTSTPAPPEVLPAASLQAPIEGDDEVSPSSSASGYRPPVRSPYRPAPRGPF